jgi:hypothetical protein
MTKAEVKELMDEMALHIWDIPNDSPRLERLEKISRTLLRLWAA